MGCSRPGALAVVCVIAAGAVAMMSLMLPYWSKIKLDDVAQEHLEVTFGLWGSCINLKPANQTTLDAPVITNGSEVIAIAPDNIASDILTCGSYFDDDMIHISCTSFRQLASGQCTRREFTADGTLCDADVATNFLGNGVKTSTISNWLRFLDSACGKSGQTSIALAVLSCVSTGLSVVLLFFGITCAKIDSCIGRMGAACAALTALIQFVIAVLWGVETRAVHGEKLEFGTSFYLNSVSMLLHSIAFLAAKTHQRLEHEALREHTGERLDEIKTAAVGTKSATGKSNETDLVAV